MHFTHDMAEAFGDWLALDRIQGALIDARPELDGAFVLDAERPLLRIQRPDGGLLLIARAADATAGRWIVGMPGRPEPVLHDTDSPDEVVSVALDALEQGSASEQDAAITDDPRRR